MIYNSKHPTKTQQTSYVIELYTEKGKVKQNKKKKDRNKIKRY